MIAIRPEDMRNPYDSEQTLLRIEAAAGCDGAICRTAKTDDNGRVFATARHDLHLIISGYNPLASPIYFAVSM
jgi:hypothetical protein